MDELQKIVVPLALTGISVFAYRHPKGYTPIHILLIILTGVFVFWATVWNSAADRAFSNLSDFLVLEHYAEAKKKIEGLRVSGDAILYSYLLMAYLMFLKYLPVLCEQDASNGPPNQKNQNIE